MTRALLYGDVDLNLIDGSAIWLASLAEVLGGMPDVAVTILLKTPLTRDVVIRNAAALPNVTFVDPWMLAASDAQVRSALSDCPPQRLTVAAAVTLITLLDRRAAFDIVLVRSIDTAAALLDLPDAGRRLWTYVTDPARHSTPAEQDKLRRVVGRCARILCQTEEAKAAMLTLLGKAPVAKFLLLPPMIPAPAVASCPALDPAAPRLGYSGKFSPPYMILEMLDAFEKIRTRLPQAEFHIVGDKFHNCPPVAGFVDSVKGRLSATRGVFWHGGVSRAKANEIMSSAHVASSWRSSYFDNTVEISTKILEYSALGIPVLMNPSPVQYGVFGSEYPGYVTTESDFIERFLALIRSPELYAHAAGSVRRTASQFTFERTRQRLLPFFHIEAESISVLERPKTILWAGHDFKFLEPLKQAIESAGSYRSVIDQQDGHVIQHPQQSRECLQQADLIFCEWCLGNAEWYSKHKNQRQRLVVRLHRQEIELPFLDRIQWENVDRIVFITPWVMDKFLARFPGMKDRALLIHNALDCSRLRKEKLPGAEFNLGLLGFCPKLKAPHRAVDILTRLKQIDRRYTLFIKGKAPHELSWLWKRQEEREYYENMYYQIDRSAYANSVIFEPHDDDVSAWFSKVGFILSTSDLEGSHQAVAEGMASGSIPVIRNWCGAEQLYPQENIFDSPAEAVELICQLNTCEGYEKAAVFAREYARKFDLSKIISQYHELLSQVFATEVTA